MIFQFTSAVAGKITAGFFVLKGNDNDGGRALLVRKKGGHIFNRGII